MACLLRICTLAVLVVAMASFGSCKSTHQPAPTHHLEPNHPHPPKAAKESSVEIVTGEGEAAAEGEGEAPGGAEGEVQAEGEDGEEAPEPIGDLVKHIDDMHKVWKDAHDSYNEIHQHVSHAVKKTFDHAHEAVKKVHHSYTKAKKSVKVGLKKVKDFLHHIG